MLWAESSHTASPQQLVPRGSVEAHLVVLAMAMAKARAQVPPAWPTTGRPIAPGLAA